MSEKRTKRYIGQVRAVEFYPSGKFPHGCAHRMMAMPDLPNASGQFFFDGGAVHFHESDRKFEKFIVYESIEQVQRTTRGKDKVKLRP